MISETGIWSDKEADEAHAFSYYTARWIANYFEKHKFVIDLGCGRGTYLQYFSDMGFPYVGGIEGSKLSSYDFDRIALMDLTKPIGTVFPGNVISIEVFEHIPAQYEKQFVENIVNSCDGKLVVSVAIEGQPGIGHVNCRNNDYVINLFEGHGFKFMAEHTKSIREKVEPHVSYLKNTLMVFEKIK